MTPHLTLAQRVEAADGPSFELEREIFEFLHAETLSKSGYQRDGAGYLTATPPFAGAERLSPPPAYTASLDAALALVTSKLGETLRDLGSAWADKPAFVPKVEQLFSGLWNARIYKVMDGKSWSVTARTPALALLAALLRALESEHG